MTSTDTPDPLIVTAELSPEQQTHYDELRKKHFPKELNHLGAHLTLFHALPGAKESDVAKQLSKLVQSTARPKATVTKVLSLGRGVAFRVEAPELKEARQQIVEAFKDDLTKQDAGKGEFHVTIQNKVTPEESKALFAELKKDFAPVETRIESVSLWRYLGGPWEKVATYPFTVKPVSAEPPEIPQG